MDWSAHNAGFVLAAYIVSAIFIIGLVIAVIAADRRRARELNNRKN
jgi:hypothetical protein